MSKYAIIPFAGEIHVALDDDFDGGPAKALEWWFDNMPDDFTIDGWIRQNGGEWDFYKNIASGNVWWASTSPEASVEDD